MPHSDGPIRARAQEHFWLERREAHSIHWPHVSLVALQELFVVAGTAFVDPTVFGGGDVHTLVPFAEVEGHSTGESTDERVMVFHGRGHCCGMAVVVIAVVVVATVVVVAVATVVVVVAIDPLTIAIPPPCFCCLYGCSRCSRSRSHSTFIIVCSWMSAWRSCATAATSAAAAALSSSIARITALGRAASTSLEMGTISSATIIFRRICFRRSSSSKSRSKTSRLPSNL
mmetsp:Transcript_1059/g.1510  ORF Transcript_1059/g.1510 Transcript_1059/m.1510 type:complete len:229 (+) Transcript_1059:568-1254(+)